MATSVSRATVAAPVQEVWDALAAFPDISRWARTVEQSSLLTSTAPGPGACRRVQVGRTTLRGNQIADGDSLLALQVNGVDLSDDHGYPARVIVPNNPGVHNTKWVERLSFDA